MTLECVHDFWECGGCGFVADYGGGDPDGPLICKGCGLSLASREWNDRPEPRRLLLHGEKREPGDVDKATD